MKKLLYLFFVCFKLSFAQTVPLSYYGNHILGPTETNISGSGISTAWPPWNPVTLRLWNSFANDGAPNYTYGGITWADINTSNGVYNWVWFDKILNKLKAQGVTDLIYTLGATPVWASGSTGNMPPTSQAYLTTFITALANRAIGLGIPVRYYEAWNEPNNSSSWGSTVNNLVTLTQTLFNAVKAVNATYKVISPSCQGYATDTTQYSATANLGNSTGTRWMNTFLAKGGGAYCDIMGFHGYIGTTYEDISTLVDTYKKSYLAYGQSAKEMWNTEAMNIANGSTRAEQATFLAVTHLLAWIKGVDRYYWYNWDDDSPADNALCKEWIYTSGINEIGTANQQLINWTVGATVNNLVINGSVYTIAVTNGTAVNQIVWNSAGSSSFTTSYTKATTLGGATSTISGSVNISRSPILLSFPTNACPTTGTATPGKYYFSTLCGDDIRTSAQATNPATPWKTVDKLNKFFATLQPGDAALFKRGETFDLPAGGFTVSRSGTSALPITIGAYGTGARPVFSGLTTVTGWSSAGTNLWKATVSGGLSTDLQVLLVNGVLTGMGRWPNAGTTNGGYRTITSSSGSAINTACTVTDNTMASTPNWNGAEIVLRSNHYEIDRSPITAHNTSTDVITYTNTSGAGPAVGYGFFIQNSLAALDAQNEWYYNPSTKELTIYSTTSPTGVQVATKANLVVASSKSDINIQDIKFLGANSHNMTFTSGARISVKNSSVEASGNRGIYVSGTDNVTIEGDSISNSLSVGVNLKNSALNSSIKNNYIYNTAQVKGLAQTDNTNANAIAVDATCDNTTIEGNTIINTGGSAINFRQSNNLTIKNNYIDTYCNTIDDIGGIYCYQGATAAAKTGRAIFGNIIRNGIAAKEGTTANTMSSTDPFISSAFGFYADNQTSDIDFHDNFIENAGKSSIFLHISAHNVNIHDNIFYNPLFYQVYIKRNAGDVYSNRITKNVFFTLGTQKHFKFYNWGGADPTVGVVDSNYFVNLNTNTTAAWATQGSTYSFSGWQGATPFDTHSDTTTYPGTSTLRTDRNFSAVSTLLDLASYSWRDGTKANHVANVVTSKTLAAYRGWAAIRVAPTAGQRPTAVSVTVTTPIACNGGTATVTVVANGGLTPYTFSSDNVTFVSNGGVFTGQSIGSKTYYVKGSDGLKDTSSIVIITQPVVLTASSTIQDSILCYGGSTNITIYGAGGTTPYASGVGTKTVAAGTRRDTIYDFKGCMAITTRTITQPALLTLTETHPAISINGGTTTVTFTAGGGFGADSFSINNGATYQSSNVFTGKSAGSYTAFVKDAHACTKSLNFTITQPTGGTVTVLAATRTSIACFGGSASVEVNPTGGTPPYDFKVGAGSYGTDSVFTGLVAGTYTFTARDAALVTGTVNKTITQPTLFTANADAVDSVLCNGSYATVKITGSGGTPLYIGTDTVSVLAGNYSYSLLDGNACPATTSVTVTQPSPLIISTNNYGVINSVGGTTSDTVVATGGTGTKTYSMDASGGVVYEAESATLVGCAVQTSVTGYEGAGYINFPGTTGESVEWTVSAPTAGTYLVKFRYALGVATARDLEISVNGIVTTASQPFPPSGAWNAWTYLLLDVALNGGSNTIKVTSTGSRGVNMDNIIVNTGYQSSPIFNGLGTGTHTATVKDANNCTVSTTFFIPNSVLTATATAPAIACNNGTTVVTVGATSGTLPYGGDYGTHVVSAGSYTYNVVDGNQDTSSVSITVANPTPIGVTATFGVVTVQNGTTTAVASAFGGGGTFSYSIDSKAYQSSSTFTGVTVGNHTITARDPNLCTSAPFSFTVVSNITQTVTMVASIVSQNLFVDYTSTVAGVSNEKVIASSGNILVRNQNYNIPVTTGTPFRTTMSIKSLIKGQFYVLVCTFAGKTLNYSFKR